MAEPAYKLIENYIYIYQLNKYAIIPVYPEQIQDSLGSTFATENILSRTAPVFSYSNSGPRSIQFTFSLHRDMMNSFNYGNDTFIDDVNEMLKNDYIDTLVKYLQAMALPAYQAVDLATNTYNSMVNPPLIACRFGNEIFIKGIVEGDVQVTYTGPISKNGKYTQVDISFTVKEIKPQDAEQIAKWGSFRGLSDVLSRGLYKAKST